MRDNFWAQGIGSSVDAVRVGGLSKKKAAQTIAKTLFQQAVSVA